MKRFFHVFCLLLVAATSVYANDYLEKDKHYNAYAAGVDKVHFVIPVWAYGKGYDYYAYEDSYIQFTPTNGKDTVIAYYKTDAYDENENKESKKGTAYLKLLQGRGSIVVTSMANGVDHLVNDNGSWTGKLIVTQKEHDDCPQVTMLEFDWYPPESLNKKEFRVKIVSKFRRSLTDGNAMTMESEAYGPFTGNQNIMDPQLYTPYIYQVNTNGPTGYGYAAIPYMLFNDPISYTTKYDNRVQNISDRGGTLYVMTNDTVQDRFYADFTMWRNLKTEDKTTKRSIAVDIPPYHRIYDFTVTEEKDSTGTFTGNNVLSWNIKNPELKDIVDGDYFEIQRAFHSDFSDAEQVTIMPMKRDSIGQYLYVDNSRKTWTGNGEIQALATDYHLSARNSKYIVYDNDNQPLVELDVRLVCDEVQVPGIPVYYRIRRASTSVWGWDMDFTKKVSMVNSNFLAPLAQEQENYTLDENYSENHKVHFRFHIENKESIALNPDKEKCKLTYSLNRVLKDESIALTIEFETGRYCTDPTRTTLFRIVDNNGKTLKDWSTMAAGTHLYPLGSTLYVKNTNPGFEHCNQVYTFSLNSNCTVKCASEWQMATENFYAYFTQAPETSVMDELSPYLPAIKDSMYNAMLKENTLSFGRCMWDRTANLILCRTIEETGITEEFYVPQDSIKRQADGSWLATFSDIADKACSHYKYAVRIDQTNADLYVQDSAALKPVEIKGQSLYFDEGATISKFTASQGEASTPMKNGVLLRWETNTNNYDDFVLLRKEQGSTASADTLMMGVVSSWLDRSAMPDKHYDYTVVARYNCNGKSTTSSADAIGWRTPYGEISGSILMPDNTGMAGVKVALQDSTGKVVSTIVTDATGYYRFDSLEYAFTVCHDPKVTFQYTNNARATNPAQYTRVRISQAGQIIQDWAQKAAGTYEYPVGTVIEIKTTEDRNDNKDVIYSFEIKGDCVLDCYNGIRQKQMLFYPKFEVRISGNTDYDGCSDLIGMNYVVVPTSQYGTFSFNNTSSATASISLTHQNAVCGGIDFVNTLSVRLTGRVLYDQSTIPVNGAMFLLNGDTVRRGNTPLTGGIDGNFEIQIPKNQPCRLQVFKHGHKFAGNGILQVEEGKDEFALDKPLDGVRFYDQTKVRLVGRVAGGNDQRDLPHGFGLGKNNLGDNLQLVLQLEGDNTAHLVHVPNDLTRDTVQQTIGETHTLFEKKRITIHPDQTTGEYAVDLFPVKYKVEQATATGYATLFASGQGNETFDLTLAPQTDLSDVYQNDTVHFNAVYDRIYHTPVKVSLSQMIYGIKREAMGEPTMEVSNLNPSMIREDSLYHINDDKTVDYLLGYPVYNGGRKYQFVAEAYEDYYFNNDPNAAQLDRVPLRGGTVTIHNGLHNAKDTLVYALDQHGTNQNIWLMVDNIDVNNPQTNALRTLSISLQQEGNTVETNRFQAFIAGTVVQEKDLRATDQDIVLLDIVRDPGGAGSSAWIESGTTYSYSYKDKYTWDAGLTINIKYGLNASVDVGLVSAPEGMGSYQGSNYTTSKQICVPIPIKHTWDWGYQHDYTITTTERISTSSSSNPKSVGSMADVFFGTTVSQISGKAKTVALIGDSLYRLRQPAIEAGTMRVLAHGERNGENYYLVTGQKIVLGSTLKNTFVYTQHYILNTVLPEIILERQNLLMTFANEEEAKAAAKATGEAVYWYHPEAVTGNALANDTLPKQAYTMVTPDDDKVYTNRVAALDNMLLKWMTIVYQNEKEKVTALSTARREVGTYSVSYGATLSHTDAFTAAANYNEVPQGGALIGSNASHSATQIGQSVLKNLMNNMKDFWKSNSGSTFGKSAIDALESYRNNEDGIKNYEELGTVTNSSKFSFSFEPIFNFSNDARQSNTKTVKKTAGFNIVADPDGDITVSCYRVPYKMWVDSTYSVFQNANVPDNEDNLYGSYVFVTQAGATFCPHEAAETTCFYNKGTRISNGTQWIVKPEMTADKYEITNVQPQNKAVFRVQLMDNSEVDAGVANSGHSLTLMLDGTSNPNGAKVTVDGMPLTQGISYWIVPGKPMIKTVEVERGQVDDYDNLTLMLYASDCMKTYANMNLSVHFLPLSCDVNIASPKQNWIMNTLSPHDSIGYYIPIDINGFDIHHKNFDHIEFQYKLSTQSDDDWVNQCSFYADDSLFNIATGNKAMIENGRIAPFRFYGERDPMEQKYDLRAVSFCRYGSGFVTKSSTVMSGTKDTRVPRVFGKPEPANAVLGVGDNLRLRFNEPIAGNYLDEDNNFSVLGVTNRIGITSTTSIGFDGTDNSFAATKATRNLSGRSFSIDMLIKPANPDEEAVFFSHGEGFEFGKTADNRLYAKVGELTLTSLPVKPMLQFTRVIMTYNNETHAVRFYAGTEDVTATQLASPEDFDYDLTANLIFGRGFRGNMLEARLWSKVLTPAQIAETHLKYLSGYERELTAYYRMNEGAGSTLTDLANGATLYCNGTTWTLPDGISLHLNGEQITLNGKLLGRNDAQDETLMFWFKTDKADASLFSADWQTNDSASLGTLIAIENGTLTLHSNDYKAITDHTVADNNWHHLVLTVNRTYNTVSLFLDGDLIKTMDAADLQPIMGTMYLGGNGFSGHIDEFAIFEQALPKSLCEQFNNISIQGDEMGLMAYLPFEEMKLNANGIYELVFSINDQRVTLDAQGNLINKVTPLIINTPDDFNGSIYADKAIYAPVRDHSKLTKLNFDWAFNNDELLINLNMADYEINKQSVYVTVRDVEDLCGNPMTSPVTWTAFVDRNSLKWEKRQVSYTCSYNAEQGYEFIYDVTFVNLSGKRHQYKLESLPDWFTTSETSGAIQPLEYKNVHFLFRTDLPVGVYNDIIYLTDEEGLSEPLYVELTLKANPPYDDLNHSKYPLNMSLCGQVLLSTDNGTIYDIDPNDRVFALYRNECVGMANIAFNSTANTSDLYLTIYGNTDMNGKALNFILWQAATGKTLTLTPSVPVKFNDGAVIGCGNDETIILTTSGGEKQNITLNAGWNWTSFNLNLLPQNAPINKIISANRPWTDGDIIKNPATQHFCTYSDSLDAFAGMFDYFRYIYTYMIYCEKGNNIYVSGNPLPADSMHLTVRGGGKWTALPCLLQEVTPITEALADYYEKASVGDVVKSHDHFATFSKNGHWVGDLTSLRPGEGYFIRRMAQEDVRVNFYNKISKKQSYNHQNTTTAFHNPAASTNMTMIATVDDSFLAIYGEGATAAPLRVYVGDELAAVAVPQEVEGETLYFLTIQSDQQGELRFELGEQVLKSESGNIRYAAHSHAGTLNTPVKLIIGKNNTVNVKKQVINGILYIFKNGRVYNAQGTEVNNPL